MTKYLSLGRRSLNKIGLVLLLPLLMIIATACANNIRLADVESTVYSNEAAYHLTLPATWRLHEEDETTTIYVAEDNAISLTMINELGGEAYYELPELVEMLGEQLLRREAAAAVGEKPAEDDETGLAAWQEQLEAEVTRLKNAGYQWQLEKALIDKEDELRYVLKYAPAEEAAVLADIYITQPYAGIRYYLIFVASESTYTRNSKLITDIVDSFAVDGDRVSLYQLMGERREQNGIEEIEE